MAVLCLRDNVRTDAVETVQILNDAGIQVVMVTGDAEETAVAIAKEAGILKDEKKDVVLTHEQLEKLSDEELKKVLPNLKVVSRAKTLDKKTFMFAFFIYAIIFNSLNTRSERFNLFEHIGENKNFVLVMGGIFILQTIIIEIGGQVFSTTMLEPKALLVSMALAVLIIPVDLIRKAIVRK